MVIDQSLTYSLLYPLTDENTLMTTSAILRLLAAISMVVLAGCGSSSDSSENVITAPPAAPQDGISGQVASSLSGGRISVADANGNDVVVATGRTTDANGRFNLVFSEFAIEDGITPPLLVTVDGEGATAICDFDGPGDSDCVSADGSSVPFGTRYNLPAGFTLSGITASYNVSNSTGFRTATVNLSAASDLATHYAVAKYRRYTFDD